MEQEFFLDFDYAGKYFIIQEEKRQEWEEFLRISYDMSSNEDAPLPEGVHELTKDFSLVVFKQWRVKE